MSRTGWGKGLIPSEKTENRSSGPEGPIDSAGIARGLKPPPPSGFVFFAAYKAAEGMQEVENAIPSGAKAHDHFAAFTARLKSCPNKKQKCKFNKTKTNPKMPVSSIAGRKHRWRTVTKQEFFSSL
jgi:hypothetical protein